MSHNVFVFSFGGKEKRGEAETGGSAGKAGDGIEAKGMPDNDVMCGECLSGRITAWGTILPAFVKGGQVPFSFSVWLPSRLKTST